MTSSGRRPGGDVSQDTAVQASTDPQAIDVAARLAAAGVAHVDMSTRRRAEYAADASLYRVVPALVVFPRDADEVCAVVAICGEEGMPVTARGAGTSVAGNAVGAGVVIDLSRHMREDIHIDAATRTARVAPGVVLDDLQRAAGAHGLRFGPDPSTHDRCTIGGMIANNACGSRALGFGRTVDHVLGLDLATGAGRRITMQGQHVDGQGVEESAAARELVATHAELIRTSLGRFGRQISGYGLHHLLPEHGHDFARALVGSEGTCGIVLDATLRLIPRPTATRLVVLSFTDIVAAAHAAPAVIDTLTANGDVGVADAIDTASSDAVALVAVEGMDERIVDVVRARRGAVPPLPRGRAWLLVELASLGTARTATSTATGRALPGIADARRLASAVDAVDVRIVDDPDHARALWRIREDGAGLAGSLDDVAAHAGFEDAAVPPQRLGDYLHDFEHLMAEHDIRGVPFGHFGDGCVHVRLTFPFAAPDGALRFRRFVTDAARLVAGYGGSMSGEHGDGRARSELLELMYSRELLDVFALFKAIFDPDAILNPGVLVDPRPIDADLRPVRPVSVTAPTAFAYPDDGGAVAAAVHRCTGIGRCRTTQLDGDQVMCPSYVATRDEKDSTRGRARVLQEMLDGQLVTGGWSAHEVTDALDLCLGCKGCLTDCPASVDMATLRAEALHQRYRRRLRPRHHYTLGWLPVWARLASVAPRLASSVVRMPLLGRALARVGGIDPQRRLPPFASRGARRRMRTSQRASARGPGATATPSVVLWADTITERFVPDVAAAAARVLEDAGVTVEITDPGACCGLTWMSTGQLDRARRVVGATVAHLAKHVRAGATIVGLEPSCTAVLRHDAVALLDNQDARDVAAATRTLAEVLASRRPEWTPPRLDGVDVLAQPHCHHRAVMGWDADRALLAACGANVRTVGGCCGLAGEFGMTRDHRDVSVAVASDQLLPAVEAATDDTVVLADGFSCRTQLADLAATRSQHLAELLDTAIGRRHAD